MSDELKPGWKCSETWIAAGSQLLKVAIAFGVVTASQGQTLEVLIGQAVMGVAAVFAIGHVAATVYTERTQFKKMAYRQPPPVMEEISKKE